MVNANTLAGDRGVLRDVEDIRRAKTRIACFVTSVDAGRVNFVVNLGVRVLLLINIKMAAYRAEPPPNRVARRLVSGEPDL
jgi:hypothetical protein